MPEEAPVAGSVDGWERQRIEGEVAAAGEGLAAEAEAGPSVGGEQAAARSSCTAVACGAWAAAGTCSSYSRIAQVAAAVGRRELRSEDVEERAELDGGSNHRRLAEAGEEEHPKQVEDTRILEEEGQHGEEACGLAGEPCRDEGACEAEQEGEAHHKPAAAVDVVEGEAEQQRPVELEGLG